LQQRDELPVEVVELIEAGWTHGAGGNEGDAMIAPNTGQGLQQICINFDTFRL